MTLSNDHCHAMAAILAILSEVSETPDPELNSSPLTTKSPRPTRHIMRAAAPSPSPPSPFNILQINPPPLPIPDYKLVFDESNSDD